MINSRSLGLDALIKIERDKGYSNIVLDKLLKKHKLEKRDRAFATEIVYGVLRHRGRIDWTINQISTKIVWKMDVTTRNILRLGVYQILFLNSVPAPIACNESVELAKEHGHKGMVKFVNGVLRNVIRKLHSLKIPPIDKDPVSHISIFHSHPSWLVERWIKRFGVDTTLKLCQANNCIPPTFVRANTIRITREELATIFRDNGIKVEKSALTKKGLKINKFDSIEKLPGFEDGLFYVQDDGSMLVSEVLCPQSGDVVVDMCGAPGGKSTHLADIMGNCGKIVTIDISRKKLSLVRQASHRLGAKIIETKCMDASTVHESLPIKADKVLIDAPCSGLGVLRRKPEIKWERSLEDIRSLSEIQTKILESGSKILKRGGILVYSTCTIELEENEIIIEKFLNNNPNFVLDNNYIKEKYDQLYSSKNGCIHLYPHLYETDGFFISRLIKK